MKKRIIALILVVVMSVLALFGCGEYDYSDAKLDKFASINLDALKSALQNLVIEDEDEFSNDPEARKKELHDIILRSFLNAENADTEEYKTGKPSYADAVYYCYYAVYTDKDTSEKHVVNFTTTIKVNDKDQSGPSMDPTYKTYVQFGVNDNAEDELVAAIEKALADYDITDKSYSLEKKAEDGDTLKVAAGNKVLVSFTYKNAEGVETKVENLVASVPGEKPEETETEEDAKLESLDDLKFFDSFLWKLVDKNVGTKYAANNDFVFEIPAAADTDGEGTEAQDGEAETPAAKKVSYTNVTVTGVVKGEAVEVNVSYPDEDDMKNKDIFGNEVNFKGKDVAYYVFPSHIKRVNYSKLGDAPTAEEYVANATEILNVFYGSASIQAVKDDAGKETGEKVGAIDIFTSKDYVLVETKDDGTEVTKTFFELMEEFVKLQKTYEDAKAALDKAKDAFDKAEDAYKDAKRNFENAVEALEASMKYRDETAKPALDKAEADKNAAETAMNTAATLLKEYKDANPDVAADDEQLLKLEAALKTATDDFNTKSEEYNKQNKEYEKAKADVAEDDAALNGKADDEKDTGLIGKYESAKEAYEKACVAYTGHVNADDDAKCDNCSYLFPEKCTHKDEAGDDCLCDICGAPQHIDADSNCVCDNCSEKLNNHVDNSDPKDCKCDQCEAAIPHVDADEDGKCDNCAAEFTAEEKKEEKSAKTVCDEAAAERDAFVKDKLLKATKKDSAEGADSIAKVIVDEFSENVYNTLEDTYFTAMNEKIMTEVYKLIDKHITVDRDKLPRKAVNEMYEKIYEDYKQTFFGSASSTTDNYYEQYTGDFERYLMDETKIQTNKYKDAKAAIKETAKDYVEEIVKIYAAASALELLYTDEEFEIAYDEANAENKQQWSQNIKLWAQYFGLPENSFEYQDLSEQEVRNGKQADKLFDYLFDINEDADERPAVKTVQDADGNQKLFFDYKNIKYTVKAKTAA